jgi:hypothetical protein
MRALESGACDVQPVLLDIGDILIRHHMCFASGHPKSKAASHLRA